MTPSADTLSRWLEALTRLRSSAETQAQAHRDFYAPSEWTLSRARDAERELREAYLEAVRREAGAA